MSTLYLIEQNTVLRKSGDRLLFCKKRPPARTHSGVNKDDILLDLPCDDIDHVMVFGNIQITTQTMQHLLQRGIELALFSWSGNLYGQLTPPGGKNIELRQMQYRRFDDRQFVLDYSQKIVYSKISAALKTVKDFARHHPQVFSPEDLDQLEMAQEKIQTAENLESLRGLEGSAAAHYFGLLGKMLPPQWRFNGRSRRPPLDAPNAVISFGYTIVYSELRSLLDGLGFDPYLGYFHQIDYGRASLALDLLELYRHAFIDHLMIKMFNLKIFAEKDFTKLENGGIYLSREGKIKFFKQYEKMAGFYRGSMPEKANPGIFRRLFQDQIANLARAVKGNGEFAPVMKLAEKQD